MMLFSRHRDSSHTVSSGKSSSRGTLTINGYPCDPPAIDPDPGGANSPVLKRSSSRRRSMIGLSKKNRPHSWHSTLQRGFQRARSRSSGRDRQQQGQQQQGQPGSRASTTMLASESSYGKPRVKLRRK